MTTPNNTPTRSAVNAYEGQTAADTNHFNKYKVIFRINLRGYASTVVEATSRSEAKRGAKQVELRDVDDYKIVEDKMTVDSVVLVSEGQSHD
jgi:hypothetical protein